MNIENLIMDFKANGSDECFRKIYEIVTQEIFGATDGDPYLRKVARSMQADFHSVKAVFDDTLLNVLRRYESGNDFLRYFKSSWRRRRASLYEDTKRLRENEGYEEDDMTFALIPDDNTVVPFAKKKADQLALIDFLLSDADETTTAIVETFLQHPKPTPTAIGKVLGLHHSVVIRKLERLAGKFDSKQYGEYRDYLVAL